MKKRPGEKSGLTESLRCPTEGRFAGNAGA